MIVVIILVALFAPVFAAITGHGVNEQFRDTGLTPDGLPVGPSRTFLAGHRRPGSGHPGAHRLRGPDLPARRRGGHHDLTVAIGAVLGLAAGYFGGIVDTIIARLIDLVLSLPYLLFAICLVSIGGFGPIKPGLPIVIIVIAVFGWAAVARIVRGQVLSIREKEYIEAARSLGASSWRIMFVDMLPNLMAQLIVYATLLIPVSIVFEAALSFLGLGRATADRRLGSDDRRSPRTTTSRPGGILLFPSLALLITTVAFNILGDGVRDALDPRLERL